MAENPQRLQREVERIHTRYQREVVEALRLCPWAQAARQAGRVRMRVELMRKPDTRAALHLLDAAMADVDVEVGMLIFPALELDRLPFSHFAAEVRAADEARAGRGQSPYAMAAFHPNAQADLRAPERLVPYLRRAPDPMLQVVRKTVLDRARGGAQSGTSFVDPSQSLASLLSVPKSQPSVAERVAASNALTVERMGTERVDALIADIMRDRLVSYAAVGLQPPIWAASSDGIRSS